MENPGGGSIQFFTVSISVFMGCDRESFASTIPAMKIIIAQIVEFDREHPPRLSNTDVIQFSPFFCLL